MTISNQGVYQEANQEDFYTVRQVAEIKGVSKQAIAEGCKQGKYPGAHKVDSSVSPRGVWLIPKKLIDNPVVIKDVAEVTRQLTPAELKGFFAEAIREEINPLRDEIKSLRAELEAHNRRVDEKLREAVNKPPEQKGFLARLFRR